MAGVAVRMAQPGSLAIELERQSLCSINAVPGPVACMLQRVHCARKSLPQSVICASALPGHIRIPGTRGAEADRRRYEKREKDLFCFQHVCQTDLPQIGAPLRGTSE